MPDTSQTSSAVPPSNTPDLSISRAHVRMSFALLLLFFIVITIVDFCARSTDVANWIDSKSIVKYKASNMPYVRMGNFPDFSEYLMLHELPNCNFDEGGAFFFGSSNVVFCADFRNTPPEQSRWIHNFGFPGASPLEIQQFIEYLIANKQFAVKNPEKYSFFICLTQDDIVETSALFQGAGGFMPSYLKTSGFFNYDTETGISDRPLNSMHKAILLHREKSRAFLQRLSRFIEPVRRTLPDVPALIEETHQYSEAQIAATKQSYVETIARTLDYLRAKKIQVTFIMLPGGTWNDDTPFYKIFHTQIPELCKQRNVPCLDWTHLLPDDEFKDGHHANFVGAEKINALLAQQAVERLRATGLLN